MSEKRGLVLSVRGKKITDEMRDQVIDSRRLTFKYMDRRKFGNGFYSLTVPGNPSSTAFVVANLLTIPHKLGYPPSFLVQQYNREAGTLEQFLDNSGISVDKTNIYLDVMQIPSFPEWKLEIVLLIGADNLEGTPDYTVAV